MFAIPRLYAMIGAGVVVALFLAWVWRVNHLRAEYKAALVACEANHKQFVADVQAKTAEAQRIDAEHKAQVEAQQTQIQSEKNDAIRNAIAAARATAGRVQPNASQNSVGRGNAAPVPQPATASLSADGAGEASELAADRMICAENTVKSEGWLSWWHSVQAIPR